MKEAEVDQSLRTFLNRHVQAQQKVNNHLLALSRNNSKYNKNKLSYKVLIIYYSMPIPSNPETTETCDKFHKFLTQLQQKGEAQYDINFDLATDVALRGCALLLVEHSVLKDDQILMLVNITKMIINGFKKEDRKRIFCANFRLYVYAEIDKCLKTEKPASTNWKRSESLGIYIAALYVESVIEKTTVKAWLTKLEFMAAIGSEEAAKVFYSTFSSVTEKFKLECPREFQQYQQFSNREKPKQTVTQQQVADDNKHASLLFPDDMR